MKPEILQLKRHKAAVHTDPQPEYDVVVFAGDWDGVTSSAGHLFKALSLKHRVLWFCMVSRMPRFSWGDALRVYRLVGHWSKKRAVYSGSDSSEQLQVITPIIIPWFRGIGRRFNAFTLRRAYRSACQRYAIRRPVVFTVMPPAVDLLNALPNVTVIYYCLDEWSQYPGLDSSAWIAMEQEVLARADGVVVTSRVLAAKANEATPILYLPHGVDYEHFANDRPFVPVPELEELPKPIVGFFGLIAEWLDFDVLEALSHTFPDVSFVLIGKIEVDKRLLPRSRNVHYLGFVPYHDLPRYARYFGVGLIPFVVNDLTQAVHPLKLLEYYALGLPVVATRLSELETCPGPLYLARHAQEFCAQLKCVLASDLAAAKATATSLARQHTWSRRASELERFVNSVAHSRYQRLLPEVESGCVLDD